MSNQNALQDDDKFPALIAHSGTAGTSITQRVVADADGNLMVNIAAGEEINIGTLSLGTIDMLTAGTVTKLEGGSIAVTAGTGIVTNGSIVVTNGTIGAGTMAVSAGTITSGSIVMTNGTIGAGSIVVTAGTITTGSIVVTSGTIAVGTVNVNYLDTGGTAHGFINNAGAPQICAQPYQEALAEGDISGHTMWYKIGYTPTMSTTESDIWSKGGVYNFMAGTVGTAMQISSSDNTNDKAGGNGALKVTIGYLDSNYATASEEITMLGTAYATTSATDIYRVNSFRVTSAGTTGKSAGTITMTNAGGTSVYGYITPGYTRARNSCYTVPAGKSLYITYANFSYGFAANQTNYARITLRANQNDGVKTAGIYHPLVEVISANNGNPINFSMPIKIVEKVDIRTSGSATAAGIADVVLRGWIE